ncbi:hypothetical protein N9D31_02220 [Oligoflexaceae bacterium]|nr:hypothetical protein [Oligoflexaceae bacterium]
MKKIFLIFLMTFFSCRPFGQNSKLQSGIGLEGAKRLKDASGAPSFFASGEWFEKFSFGQERKAQYHLTPAQYRAASNQIEINRVVSFLDKEIFRLNKFNQGSIDLRSFIDQEADELYEIIYVLLNPQGYDPSKLEFTYKINTHSPIASYFASVYKEFGDTKLLDAYAQDLISGSLSKEIGSFTQIVEQLHIERGVFAQKIYDIYKSKPELLKADIAKVMQNFLALKGYLIGAKQNSQIEITGVAASFLYFQWVVNNHRHTRPLEEVKTANFANVPQTTSNSTDESSVTKESSHAPDDSLFGDEGSELSDVQDAPITNNQSDQQQGEFVDVVPSGGGDSCTGGLVYEDCNGVMTCLSQGQSCPIGQQEYLPQGTIVDPSYPNDQQLSNILPGNEGFINPGVPENIVPFDQGSSYVPQSGEQIIQTTSSSGNASDWTNPLIHHSASLKMNEQHISCQNMKNLTVNGRLFCERVGSYTSAGDGLEEGQILEQDSSQINQEGNSPAAPTANIDWGPLDTSDLASAMKAYAGKTFTTIVKAYASEVKNQGPNGTCTAQALTHTVEALKNKAENDDSFFASADEFWDKYRIPSMESAITKAMSYTFSSTDGKTAKVKAVVRVKNVTELFKLLEQDEPLYAASGVNSSWMNNGNGGGDGIIKCGDEPGDGHAYSIQGLMVNDNGESGYLLVKNSWGPEWGFNKTGYAKMPLGCLTKFTNYQFQIGKVILEGT